MRINSTQLRQIIKEELGRSVHLREVLEEPIEGDDPSMLDFMGGGDAPGTGGGGKGDMTINTWNKMSRKPVGFIVDLEGMMSSGGGYYPLYFSDGKQIVKLSDDVGEVGYMISEMLGDPARLPAGMWVSGHSDGGDGPWAITNRD